MSTDQAPKVAARIPVPAPVTALGLGRGKLTLQLIAATGWCFAAGTQVSLHITVPDFPETLEIAEQRVADATGEATLEVNIITIVKPGEALPPKAGICIDLKATLWWGGDSSLDVHAAASFQSELALTDETAGAVALALPLPEPR